GPPEPGTNDALTPGTLDCQHDDIDTDRRGERYGGKADPHLHLPIRTQILNARPCVGVPTHPGVSLMTVREIAFGVTSAAGRGRPSCSRIAACRPWPARPTA